MKKPLILVVDDNIDNISVLEELLKEFGYEFNSINESTMILQVLEYQIPDLILLDYFMPEQDGLETIKILKNHAKFADIPVIVLTADTDKETLAKFFREGAVDFLHKPINHIELKARIASTLKITSLNHELKKKMTLVNNQNYEIDMFSKMVFIELNDPLEIIGKYAKLIETSEELSYETIREFAGIIRQTQQGISFQISNLLNIIGVMNGKNYQK